MKKNLLLLAIAFLGFVKLGQAQAQNPECLTNLSIYTEYVKVKNYDAAYEPWKQVYETCPSLNWANFLYGERILKDKIKKSEGAEKSAFINDLLALFEGSQQYFPKKVKLADVKTDIALLKHDEKLASKEEVFNILHEGFTQDQKNFDNPKALYMYFSNLVDLNAEGTKSLDEVFEIYDDVVNQIEVKFDALNKMALKLQKKEESGSLTSRDKRMKRVVEANSKAFSQISSSIDTKLGQLADCSNLIPLYEKNFEDKKDNIKWVKSAVSRMFSKDCTDDPMFVKLVEAQTELDPSADSFFYLGLLNQKQGDNSSALSNFNKAVELESDNAKKSKILYKIAQVFEKTNKRRAKSYASRAISADRTNGRAYLLIARLYANSANECGETTFEKRAIYWLASQMAKKANVDLSLRRLVAKTVESYEGRAPSRTDIFESGMSGKAYTFKGSGCFCSGESVKVPSLD